MPRLFRLQTNLAVVLATCVLMALSGSEVSAEPTAAQTIYWWQDEIREAGFAWSIAKSGKVSQWPAISVSAGTATLPLPLASGAIQADGRLDEPAWQRATSFPVGPIFGPWSQGPFLLQVRACRDAKTAYLAIESPHDLTGLGTLTPSGELFTVNSTPYHLGQGSALPEKWVGRRGARQVVEMALPIQGAVSLTFAAEVVHRKDGSLPVELSSLGLQRLAEPQETRDFRKPWLWLEPIQVRLLPASAAARLSLSPGAHGSWQLSSEVSPANQAANSTVQTLASTTGPIVPYAWKAQADGKEFSMEGFVYLSRSAAMAALGAAREIADRSARMDSRSNAAELPEVQIAALEREAQRLPADDDGAWRSLYRRAREVRARAQLSLLDAPLLFVKQHPYFAAHIYDDYYTWHPGGGIYVLEAPHDPRSTKVRPVIDPATNQTLGEGVYRDAELSWDARQVVFAHKPTQEGMTNLYRIGVDGRGLKRLTTSDEYHDVTPDWLPNGRIVFTSTRPKALVPCFNSGVSTLHTMRDDGSDLRSISSNLVTEFDPAVMPDGRILYGRWEYVDKTALYIQSLWTMTPDGRMEEALFGNNICKPTAILDAVPVPGSRLVAASLTPHNGQALGAIAMIDPSRGKNDLAAVTNFTPEYPVEMDQGLRSGPCDPYPLGPDDVLVSNNAIGAHGILELIDRQGHRELVHCDPAISCFNPRLVKPRQKPPVVSAQTEPNEPGRFLLVDVYQGLPGVPRGTIKRLRILEETARTSGIPAGGRWWNQAFLVSWQGAYIVKNILGTVPVHEDGSAYFELAPGRAVYFEALDAEGREIQRMRTFVQAAPGTTRSCIGCHEYKKSSPLESGRPPLAMLGAPARPEPESWGDGYIDYPTMIQPILDRYCVSCHGGTKGMADGLDFSGGWTWAFSISYETLIKQRLTGFLNCNNASVHTAQILPPRTIGSGAAPLAEILIKKHPEMKRSERDLVLAWMDTNSNYYGTWDYTPHATCDAILGARAPLASVMSEARCTKCHAPGHIGNDWINLQTPEWSRILRAPMAKSEGGLGLEMCRKRKAQAGYPLVQQPVQPPDVLLPTIEPAWDPSGEPAVSIASTDDPHYQAMLGIIRRTRAQALARPRIDMPGAEIVPGVCRIQVPQAVPKTPPQPTARLRADGAVELSWRQPAELIGLQYEIHRGTTGGFTPADKTRIGLTTAGRFVDPEPPVGQVHYALLATNGTSPSGVARCAIGVTEPAPPGAPTDLAAEARPGEIRLSWVGPEAVGVRYNVYRQSSSGRGVQKLNAEPVTELAFVDQDASPQVKGVYTVSCVDRRGRQSKPSTQIEATALPEVREPVFATDFAAGLRARLVDGSVVGGQAQRGAKVARGVLELGESGQAVFDHRPEFDLTRGFSVECWVKIDRESPMPVVVACGAFNSAGWFLQRYGRGWRWHLAPASCDGGRPVNGRWTHLAGTFDGRTARLYQDGRLVASVEAFPNPAAWPGALVIGQYVHASPNYQVQGAITGLKIYHRALSDAELAESSRAEPQSDHVATRRP